VPWRQGALLLPAQHRPDKEPESPIYLALNMSKVANNEESFKLMKKVGPRVCITTATHSGFVGFQGELFRSLSGSSVQLRRCLNEFEPNRTIFGRAKAFRRVLCGTVFLIDGLPLSIVELGIKVDRGRRVSCTAWKVSELPMAASAKKIDQIRPDSKAERSDSVVFRIVK
jgi:hypothetical protein